MHVFLIRLRYPYTFKYDNTALLYVLLGDLNNDNHMCKLNCDTTIDVLHAMVISTWLQVIQRGKVETLHIVKIHKM